MNVSLREPDILVVSNASGSWGCGVYWLCHWLAVKWPPHLQDLSIQRNDSCGAGSGLGWDVLGREDGPVHCG